MVYRRDVRGMRFRKKRDEILDSASKIPYRIPPYGWLLVGIGALLIGSGIYMGSSVFSDPDYRPLDTSVVTDKHLKPIVIADVSTIDDSTEVVTGQNTSTARATGSTDNGKSGILFGTYPGELFAISMTGEGSGAGDGLMGDHGKAYGLMQFDYANSLVDWCRWSSTTYPTEWGGLSAYANVAKGSSSLKGNNDILKVFQDCQRNYPDVFIQSQCDYIYGSYFSNTKKKLAEKGIDLDQRNIAVSAAILALNVNCGEKAKTISNILNPSMTDEEMINTLYANRRNGVLKSSGTTFPRWTEEPKQCIALLNGTWRIDQDYTASTSYSAGWLWSNLKPIYFN